MHPHRVAPKLIIMHDGMNQRVVTDTQPRGDAITFHVNIFLTVAAQKACAQNRRAQSHHTESHYISHVLRVLRFFTLSLGGAGQGPGIGCGDC
jgi:hypothetical protein